MLWSVNMALFLRDKWRKRVATATSDFWTVWQKMAMKTMKVFMHLPVFLILVFFLAGQELPPCHSIPSGL